MAIFLRLMNEYIMSLKERPNLQKYTESNADVCGQARLPNAPLLLMLRPLAARLRGRTATAKVHRDV